MHFTFFGRKMQFQITENQYIGNKLSSKFIWLIWRACETNKVFVHLNNPKKSLPNEFATLFVTNILFFFGNLELHLSAEKSKMDMDRKKYKLPKKDFFGNLDFFRPICILLFPTERYSFKLPKKHMGRQGEQICFLGEPNHIHLTIGANGTSNTLDEADWTRYLEKNLGRKQSLL